MKNLKDFKNEAIQKENLNNVKGGNASNNSCEWWAIHSPNDSSEKAMAGMMKADGL